MRRRLAILIFISTLLLMQGCAGKQNNGDPSANNNGGISDSDTNGELINGNKLTLPDLRDILETSDSIEVKDPENQVIGQVIADENINKAIENVFSYNVVNSYENFSREKVIATISFYPDRDYPIYGLIKEKFIYIEGYYFVANNNGIQEIINYFEKNTETRSVVD